MNRLVLFRFDDALDYHVLMRDSRPMVTLLSSPELANLDDVRSLADQLANSTSDRQRTETLEALLALRRRIANLAP